MEEEKPRWGRMWDIVPSQNTVQLGEKLARWQYRHAPAALAILMVKVVDFSSAVGGPGHVTAGHL